MIDWSNLDRPGIVTARAAVEVELEAPRPDLTVTIKQIVDAVGVAQEEVPEQESDEAKIFRAGLTYLAGMLICGARQALNDQKFQKRFEEVLTGYAKQEAPIH